MKKCWKSEMTNQDFLQEIENYIFVHPGDVENFRGRTEIGNMS